MRYEVEVTESALDDLAYLTKAERNVIVDEIENQLTATPLTQTRNRKPLRSNDLAAWEMRIGSLRAFYDVDEEAGRVFVKAVGWKEHNKLFIRGKEYEL
jgi:mRNA-degrading endonuclease RelE of RelBE toxin-antitoxin system